MKAPNEQIRAFGHRVCLVLNAELRGMLLSKEDECGVLLSAAHGRAREAGMTREKFLALAAFVYDLTEKGLTPGGKRSLDFEVRDLPMKIFEGRKR